MKIGYKIIFILDGYYITESFDFLLITRKCDFYSTFFHLFTEKQMDKIAKQHDVQQDK